MKNALFILILLFSCSKSKPSNSDSDQIIYEFITTVSPDNIPLEMARTLGIEKNTNLKDYTIFERQKIYIGKNTVKSVKDYNTFPNMEVCFLKNSENEVIYFILGSDDDNINNASLFENSENKPQLKKIKGMGRGYELESKLDPVQNCGYYSLGKITNSGNSNFDSWYASLGKPGIFLPILIIDNLYLLNLDENKWKVLDINNKLFLKNSNIFSTDNEVISLIKENKTQIERNNTNIIDNRIKSAKNKLNLEIKKIK